MTEIFKKLRHNQYKTFSGHLSGLKRFEKENKTCDFSRNRVTHHMFYLLFFETFESTQMISKMFYIDFNEVSKKSLPQAKCFIFYMPRYNSFSLTR